MGDRHREGTDEDGAWRQSERRSASESQEPMIRKPHATGDREFDRVLDKEADSGMTRTQAGSIASREEEQTMVAEVERGKELTTLQPRRASISVQANLKPLLWTLAHQMPALCGILLEELGSLGVDPSDMRIDNGDGSLEGYNLNFWALDFRARCEIRLSRVEIECGRLEQVETQDLNRLLQVVLGAVERTDSNVGVNSYEIVVYTHGVPIGTTPQAFLQRFACRGVDGLGPNIGNGAAFHFGGSGVRTNCSISVDISRMFLDSIFVEVRAGFDGAALDRRNLRQETDALLTAALEALDLSLPAAETGGC